MLGIQCDNETLNYGAISTATPEASIAGMEILQKGGNAVDAAIVISLVLGVTEPAMSGLGGGTQVLIKLAGRTPFSINGSSISPALTMFGMAKDSMNNYQRTTIPSTMKVLSYLFENYSSGNLTWSELCQPAIALSQQGFKIGEFRNRVYEKNRMKLKEGQPHTSVFVLDDGYHPIQLKLVNALQEIADYGPESFYNGPIAESIERDMIENEGWIRIDDLRNFPQPKEIESIHFQYKGFDIYTQPEPCGGWVIQEILQDLEKQVFKNEFEEMESLIKSINYGHQKRIDIAKRPMTSESEIGGETTHFSVLDADGMGISVTASINAYYGGGVANSQFGFLYNSYMDDFNFEEENNKYALGPHKMAYSSMCPTMVMKDEKLEMILGSPGSSRIISTVAQVIHYYAFGTLSPQELVSKARVHSYGNNVFFEAEGDALKVSRKLQGSNVKVRTNELGKAELNPYFGGVHAIIKKKNSYEAIADPRRDGQGVKR